VHDDVWAQQGRKESASAQGHNARREEAHELCHMTGIR